MMMIEKIAEASVHAQSFQAHNPGTDAHGQFGAGGVTKGPINAVIGEKGPEVVVPLKKKFMNKKVKDVVRYFKSQEIKKQAAKKKMKIGKIAKKPHQHGGYEEKKDGSLNPNTSLGNRQATSEAALHGSQMGSLFSSGWLQSQSVRGGSQPNLRG